MKNIFAVLILACITLSSYGTPYLYIDKFVSELAAGGGDGAIATPYTWAEAIAAVKPGWRINIKADGVYAMATTTSTWATNGKADSLIWIRGYNTVPGDLDTNYSGSKALPVLTSTTGQFLFSGNFYRFTELAISGACVTSPAQVNVSGNNIEMARCRITCTGTSSNSVALRSSSANNYLWGCYFTASTSANVITGGGKFVGNIFNGGLNGISSGNITTLCEFGLFTNQANSCVLLANATSTMYYTNCSFHKAAADGISMTTTLTTASVVFDNCIIDSCAGYPFNNSSGTPISLVKFNRCYAYANGHGDSLIGLAYSSVLTDTTINFRHNGIDIVTPFASPSTFNFHLNSTSVAKRGGYPGVFDSVGLIGYLSAGAVQNDSVCPACPACTYNISARVDSLLVHLYHAYIDSMRYDTTTKICTWHKPNGDVTRRDTIKQSGTASTDSITKAKSLFYPAVMTYAGLADTLLLDSIDWMKFNRWKYSLADSTQKIYDAAGSGTLKTRKGKPGTTVTRSVY